MSERFTAIRPMTGPVPRRARALVLAVAAFALAACGRRDRPDILLVVLDTVRADHLMPYGYRLGTSYRLRELAESGVLFTDVTAPAPWTWPSHASLFTGEPPWVHGAHFDPHPDGDAGAISVGSMRTDLPTIAERLAEAGYDTVALSANVLLRRELGLTRGFGRVEIGGDGDVVAKARATLASPRDRPLFLFVNFISAHDPYRVVDAAPWSARHRATLEQPWISPYVILRDGAPELLIGKRPDPTRESLEEAFSFGQLELDAVKLQVVRDLYDGELVRLDNALGDLLDAWRMARHQAQAVVVTSDHGEYLGEHHRLGHGHTLHREVLQIPLVIVAPARASSGASVTAPVQLQDLYATLLDIAGIRDGGFSLLDAMAGVTRPAPIQAETWADPAWAAEGPEPFRTGYRYFREGSRALVLDDSGRGVAYDLDADPGMVHPRDASSDPMLARARGAFPVVPSEPMSGAERESLRDALHALGYVR